MTQIYSTEVGRRVARSGLLPETANFLLSYLSARHGELVCLLPDRAGHGGNPDGLNYCLLSAALMSPEFSGLTRTRFIHYGFEVTVPNSLADRWSLLLAEQPWQAYRAAVNAAALMMEWIAGAPFAQLERRFQAVRAGTVEGMCREVVWCLAGLADIVAAATRPDSDDAERPSCLRSATAQSLREIRRLIPFIRLLGWRLSVGLPETVLWLSEARTDVGHYVISRREALALHSANLGNYAALRQRNNWSDVITALRAAGVPNAQDRAREIQKVADSWHMKSREKVKERLISRMPDDKATLFEEYFESRETPFERALEALLDFASIRFTPFDKAPRQGAFDYILHIGDRPDFPLECKSKQGNSPVALNEATDVLRATDLYGFSGASCATVCQPLIDPNVPPALISCDRLCVVEAHVLAEVLGQVALGRASAQDLHDWLSQPGLATIETFLSNRQAGEEAAEAM